MRTLPAALTAAQQAASGEPYVEAVAENSIAAIRRLDFVEVDATAHAVARHDAAVAADGSLTRVRAESGAVKQQRVTNTSSGPWTSWNTLASGVGAQVACAARGARVAVVYTDAAGTGIKLRESTDNGATFTAEVAVTTAASAVLDLAVACKNTGGDLAVAWAAGTSVGIIKRTSGVFGSATTTAPGASSLSGIALVYGFDWDAVLTGVEAGTLRPTLWTLAYGDGNDVPVNTWSTAAPQAQAESDAQVSWLAPSIVFTDTYRIAFVEADAFTGGATRTWRTWLHPAASFVAGPFSLRTPLPTGYTGAEGLALAADAGNSGYVYECAPDTVRRAAQAQTLLALSGDLIAADITERGDGVRGHLDIDNSHGLYAGPPAALAPGNLVAVSWGYRTAAGPLASRMADLWIAAVEHRRSGGASFVRLHVEGAWELLRRNAQRAQVTHTTDTALAILARIFARAGIQLTAAGASTRATTLTPSFTIASGMDGYAAAAAALAALPDRIRLKPLADASILEPLAGAASAYTFGGAHPLREARIVATPPAVSSVQAFGAGAYGEAFDLAAAAAALGAREQRRDAASATGAAAAATAGARLRARALDAPAGQITVPPHTGLELLDVIDLADAHIAAAPVKRRVAGIRWRLDRRRGIYEQVVTLGAL